MTKLIGEKVDFYDEDVAYRNSVSEALLAKIGKSIQWHNENTGDLIGDTKQSILTESQFCLLKGDDHTNTDYISRKWVLMSGQDITGSDLHTLTGITTLPNATSTKAFFRQGPAIGEYQSNQNLSHSHTFYKDNYRYKEFAPSLPIGLYGIQPIDSEVWGGSTTTTTTSGGDESRPNNYQMNFFIKINN